MSRPFRPFRARGSAFPLLLLALLLGVSALVTAGPADDDEDGVANDVDVCVQTPNPGQEVASQFDEPAQYTPYGLDRPVGCACLCGDVNGTCVINALGGPSLVGVRDLEPR